LRAIERDALTAATLAPSSFAIIVPTECQQVVDQAR
jgi:hypothetical protein